VLNFYFKLQSEVNVFHYLLLGADVSVCGVFMRFLHYPVPC